ncbi:hypothetical protein MTR67_005479 [Solanum verrucosum]|uniref:Uncharacterized protein n=1 Tax=Solanum verrucosum TaxID=315347 RepID=A0AAF0Q262_SOLVR|nr:hypothetical protein MTR67_005479 [Solanum verrucosum]
MHSCLVASSLIVESSANCGLNFRNQIAIMFFESSSHYYVTAVIFFKKKNE